eukprot:SAG31_NODE_4854_length_2904_cov_1.684492_4_plen_279_part_00
MFVLTQEGCGERARYVSFSAANDDCSWYEDCRLSSHNGYTSVAIRSTPPPPPPPSNFTRIAIPRVTVSTGTVPQHSQWARVPIPACRYTGAQRMASDPQHHTWINCTAADCASCCEHPVRLSFRIFRFCLTSAATVQEMVRAPGTPGAAQNWWRYQDCVAACAGNGLHGSCTAEDVGLQFAEPIHGMSSLWSGWQWCGARSPAEDGTLGDSPGTSCSSNNPMMATNIVDQVHIPREIDPGNYLLSWRWDCEQVRAAAPSFFSRTKTQRSVHWGSQQCY